MAAPIRVHGAAKTSARPQKAPPPLSQNSPTPPYSGKRALRKQKGRLLPRFFSVFLAFGGLTPWFLNLRPFLPPQALPQPSAQPSHTHTHSPPQPSAPPRPPPPLPTPPTALPQPLHTTSNYALQPRERVGAPHACLLSDRLLCVRSRFLLS